MQLLAPRPKPTPVVAPPAPAPMADDEATKRARRQALAEQQRSGRASTILSQADATDKLGG